MLTAPKLRAQVDALWGKFWTGARESVFLQKRHLENADLYEPPLDMFGTDAVERWFTEKEVNEVVKFVNQLSVM